VHKFFAKTHFLGKKADFLPECHSTNVELHYLLQDNKLPEGYVLHADYQKAGKGQRGNTWESAVGDNLLFSVYLKPTFLDLRKQHLLTFAPALAVREVISQYCADSNSVQIKWPNDVYINDKKIAGILTECSIQGGLLQTAIVGIGCNINQRYFENERATSLSLLSGLTYDRFEILEDILLALEKEYFHLKAGKEERLLTFYQESLWRRGEQHFFEDEHGRRFQGAIIGITKLGHLSMDIGGSLQTFNFKEIKYLP
jgi:BirA family biotin operon repressor/biotin-[acetyl-CoA-carboxylase] ligase